MPEKYVLKTTVGVTIEARIGDDGFHCHWTPAPPYSRKACKRIAHEYEPWRNQIFADYARRTGKSVMVVTLPAPWN